MTEMWDMFRAELEDTREDLHRRRNKYGRCEVRLDGCQGNAVHTHHRKLRSQGGKDDPDNLLRVCFTCHRWIHANPALSYELGLLVRSYADPSTIPIGAA